MIQWIFNLIFRYQEKKLGGSLDYLRFILKFSRGGFFKFIKILPLSMYRKKLSKQAFHLSKLVATQDADCGTCLQIQVNLALKDKMKPELIKNILEGTIEDLTEDLKFVYHFTNGLLKANGDDEKYRPKIVEVYGEEGLVELALAISSCRVFPLTKRALGFAVSCKKMDIKFS